MCLLRCGSSGREEEAERERERDRGEEQQREGKREREEEQTDRKGEGEEGSIGAPHLDLEQRRPWGTDEKSAAESDEKPFLQTARQTDNRERLQLHLTSGISSGTQEYTAVASRSFKEKQIFPTKETKSKKRQHGLHCHSHFASVLEPVVLELLSTTVRGNENSSGVVESRTARQTETDRGLGQVSQA